MSITTKDLQKALPATAKITITQRLADQINAITTDPIVAENIRDNFVSYTNVLQDGKYSSEEYVNAVSYVSFKLMGMSNKDAYINTFPSRYQQLLAKGASEKDISAYVHAYHRTKLVTAITEQALIPMWLVNQDLYQKALNTQAELMRNAASEMVRTQAANSILTHLAKPKDAVPMVAIQVNQSSGMVELQNMLTELAEKQVNLINDGVTAKEIAAQKLRSK